MLTHALKKVELYPRVASFEKKIQADETGDASKENRSDATYKNFWRKLFNGSLNINSKWFGRCCDSTIILEIILLWKETATTTTTSTAKEHWLETRPEFIPGPVGGSGRGGGGKQHNEEMSLEDKWHASIGCLLSLLLTSKECLTGRVATGKLL